MTAIMIKKCYVLPQLWFGSQNSGAISLIIEAMQTIIAEFQAGQVGHMNQFYTISPDEQKKEVKRLLLSILKLPDNDSASAVRQLILYLNQIMRIRSLVPPTSEIMILLQAYKPLLYDATRFGLSKSSHLNVLFQIKGEVRLAEQRLHEFLDSL